MSINIDKSACWSTAHEFIAKGEIEKALEICLKQPCEENLECQIFLGWTYYERADFDIALKWFGKAGAQGDAEAIFGIGCVYYMNNNFVAAIKYFQQAAESGFGRSFQWLGYMYNNALGVPKNIEMATYWYKRGAAQGFLVAERDLIHLIYTNSNIIKKICILPRLICLRLKSIFILLRNLRDYRTIDIYYTFKGQIYRHSAYSKKTSCSDNVN